MNLVRLTAVLAALPLLGLAAPARSQENASEGERLFRARCASCHSIDPGRNRIGPHLAALVGRKAGSIEGARYSEAMLGSGIVWNPATLDSYLDDPRRVVPGTTMTFALRDAAQRRATIAYLRELPNGPKP